MDAVRGKKFSEEEKLFLLQLVDAQKGTLLCQKTDQVSNRQKADAWKSVTNCYNERFPQKPRSANSLKVLYGNLKRKTKQNVAMSNRDEYLKKLRGIANQDRREITRTGGGSYTPQLTNAEGRVLAMLGDTVKPLQNPYDSAADYFNDKPSTSTIPDIGNPEPHPEPCPEPRPESRPEPSTAQNTVTTPNTVIPLENSEYHRAEYYRQKTFNAQLQQKVIEHDLELKKKQIKLIEIDLELKQKQLDEYNRNNN